MLVILQLQMQDQDQGVLQQGWTTCQLGHKVALQQHCLILLCLLSVLSPRRLWRIEG